MWIEKLSDGRFKYIERYVDPYTEKQKRMSTILTSESPQAIKKATKILDDSISKKIKKSGQVNMTFEQLYEAWLPVYSQNVKKHTVKTAESAYRVVTRWFDDKSVVRNIDAPYLQKLLNDFYYTKGYSHAYTDLLRSFLSNVLEYGYQIGVCDSNVVRLVKLKKNKKTKTEAKSVDEKYLEINELELVLKTIREWKAPITPARRIKYAEILELQALTGMRFGEAAALREDDLEGNVLTIDETLYYNYGDLNAGETDTPKNEFSIRKIVLSNRALEIVNGWVDDRHVNKAIQTDYNDMGFLFCTNNGIPIGISPVNRILRNVRKKLKDENLLNKNLTTHYFRHTHISFLAEMGLPLKTIMARVGHENPNTTLKIYTHVTEKMEEHLLDRLNEFDEKRGSKEV